MLAAFLRSVRLGLLALAPNSIPLVLGVAFLQLTGKSLDIGTVVVFSVCLGIAVDDTIHILTEYRRLQARGQSEGLALAGVFANRAPALIMTTVILVLAFGTFLLGSFVPNIMFGFLCAIILTAALVADLTLLPVLLFRSPKRVGDVHGSLGHALPRSRAHRPSCQASAGTTPSADSG